MKTIKIALSVLFCLIILFACNKINEPKITNDQTPKVVTAKTDLDSFIQNHFQNKFQLMFENSQLKSASISGNIYSEYATKAEAEKMIIEVNNEKLLNAQTEIQYQGFEVKTKIRDGTLEEKNDQITFQVYVYSKFNTDSYDTETGNQLNPTGIDLYEFIVTKQGQGYVIVNEDKINFINGPEAEQLNDITYENNNLPLKSAVKYSYSSTKAVSFATSYWNNVSKVKNYYDYTKSNGDCTNFLSWCFLMGGWATNNSWFFTSNGSSGNDMKKYTRSPSWTGADYFYQYITATGSMYRNSNGNNRVTSLFTNLVVPNVISLNWAKFYDKVKLLRLGDIIAIGDGRNPATIHHNMIVTGVLTKAPYIEVTYRNAYGNNYSPYLNKPINKLNAGDILYGFNVNSSAN